MELQWNKKACVYLQTDVHQVVNQEQTQEIRLPDGMPDIGRVLCAWGQPTVRSKEWRNDGMSVSGGVAASVLYQPEDGSEPRCAEVWIPFQARWSFPQAKREGSIRTRCLLRSIDARTLSARKLMVRASVGVLGIGLEPAESEVYIPGEVPAGVERSEEHTSESPGCGSGFPGSFSRNWQSKAWWEAGRCSGARGGFPMCIWMKTAMFKREARKFPLPSSGI